MHTCTKLLLCCLLVGVGCSRSAPTTSGTVPSSATPAATTIGPGSQPNPSASSDPGPDTRKNKVDACALLTSRDLQAVQGEALKEAKPSTRSDSGFKISQCFYTLPTFANSISLLVAQKGESAGARDPKEFWQDTFHHDDEAEKERAKAKERHQQRDKTSGRESEEEKGIPGQKIDGVGDEAYWTGNRVGGALYALKGNTYIRISVGGPGDQAAKIKKSKLLAQIILKRI